MQIFARLSKVNESDRTVEGVIASEAVDRSGEVFDYEKSVPHFKDWSESIAKATDGKNLGNVRAMHGKVSAGVTKTLTFDDAAKQITVKAEIVDDNEWQKVLKGCYSGFSIGGKYGAKWDDPVLKAQRYEAIPSEYSLVDLPCNPEAQFTVVKADGSEELRKFESVEKIDEAHEPPGSEGGEFAPTDGGEEPEKMSAKDHRKAAFDHENQATREERAGNLDAATAHRTAADAHEYAASLKSKRDPNADWKSKKAQHWTRLANAESNKAGHYHNPVSVGKSEGAGELEKIAERKDVSPKEGEDKYGSVEYADPTNKKYPIDTEEHIRAAWSYIHMPKNSEKYSAEDAAKIKERIASAWRSKIDPKGPPEAEKMADADLEKTGRKHTKATRAHRKAIEEHLAQAKAHLDAMAADDPANDPDDDGDADEDTQKLAKAAQDATIAAQELAKVVGERDQLQADLEKIHAEVKRLSELPVPPKGVVTAVEKTMGLPDEAKAPTEIKKADGSIDHLATAAALMKSTYANRRTLSL